MWGSLRLVPGTRWTPHSSSARAPRESTLFRRPCVRERGVDHLAKDREWLRPGDHCSADEKGRSGLDTALVARSMSASMVGFMRCAETQPWNAGMSTPAADASESNIGCGAASFSHGSCVAKSASCIGQNLSCAAAHIAVSAAGIALRCIESGKFMYARRTFPESTYALDLPVALVVPLLAVRTLKVAHLHQPHRRGCAPDAPLVRAPRERAVRARAGGRGGGARARALAAGENDRERGDGGDHWISALHVLLIGRDDAAKRVGAAVENECMVVVRDERGREAERRASPNVCGPSGWRSTR